MAADQTYVHVQKFGVSKIFDNAFKAKVQTLMTKEATRWIEKSKFLTAKGDKKQDGFYLDGSLQLLKGAAGGKTMLAGKVDLQLATWPKKSMFAFPSGGAKVEVLDEAKIDRDVEDLVNALMESVMTKQVVKELETRAKKAAKSK